jgi:hypothetical protein
VADIIEVPECFIDDDCELNEVCDDGTCVVPSPECEVSGDCGLGDECVAGTCVFIQGTCNVTDDHCSVTEALCNPAAGKDCFCLQRFGGGVACAERFVPDAICGACNSDAACEALEAGSICVKAVTQGAQGCPCDPGLGICARLCPNQ